MALLTLAAAGFHHESKIETVTLTFELELDRRVYEYTDYGEAPQIAVWLEQPDTGAIRTLFVTRRTARGEWLGKVECPVSLPYWVSRYNKETGASGLPNPKKPVPDALSGATPRGTFGVAADVPRGSTWHYFVEINASGDFNRRFPSQLDDGTPDPQGNGQPSLVYQGRIEALPGKTSMPKIIGRSDQFDPVTALITDLSGITSARNLLSRIVVSVSSVEK